MNSRNPPLTALRAFDAAARHLSLKRAAEELNVTPAAITHQIHHLETFLGTELFTRGHRKIELTDVGYMLVPKIAEGFECFRRAVDLVRERNRADVVNVIAPPSFSSQWLMPKLHRFASAHPEIDIHVSTRMREFGRAPAEHRPEHEMVNSWMGECDALICLGSGRYAGLEVDEVLPLTVTPLCHPSLLEQGLKLPQDVGRFDLLHDERGLVYDGRSFWDLWLEAAGLSHIDRSRGRHFTHSALAIEAAIAGDGIVASTLELVQQPLAANHLVAPFDLRIRWTSSYYLVTTRSAAKKPVVQTFREWLLKIATDTS